eukprot:CAMPEP_0178959326 /NCGR_PEP_ID=MMETSP0789-20121207/12225_1 /TAXON_ID=3005 /ORGANISM="Rhizosolenia setigera, Strain CCMP 1694" /LENGTH=236 /DNA_ID=CAMNT_0020642309 /DNA_START=867 /DNA_END=1578 /DNA_ORIENTATION=-
MSFLNSHQDRAEFMPPTLQEWLDAWVLAIGDESKIKEYKQKFHCYNPIDLQSSFVRFDPDVQPTAEEDLLKRYDVIGTSDEMVKSLCATFISFQRYVPEKCDCTDTTLRKRRIRNYDHGVVHHRNSYETTQEEDEAIAKLTQKDQQLYELTQKVFEKQVLDLEEMFGIKICSSFKTDEDNRDNTKQASGEHLLLLSGNHNHHQEEEKEDNQYHDEPVLNYGCDSKSGGNLHSYGSA